MEFLKKFNKDNIKSVAVLIIICLVSALLMGCVNMLTAPIISDRNAENVLKSLKQVMPDGEFNTEPDERPENAPETVKQIYTEKNGKGTVVILETKGYEGVIGLTVAIGTDGKIINMVITQNGDSIVPDNLKPFGDYGNAYIGVTESEVTDLVTGATVSFTEAGIKKALKDAFAVVGGNLEERLPKTDEEIVELAEALLGATKGSLENVTPDGSGTVKRVYRDEAGDNYAVYLVVISSHYGTVETETLVHIDREGVVKGIEKLTWKVSDPAPDWGYNPPSEEALETLYDSIVGKDSETMEEVDLTTGATNSTTSLVNSVLDAIKAVKTIVAKDMPSPYSEVLALAKTLLGDNALVEVAYANGTVKRVFRDAAGDNYAVYLVVFSDRYGAPETETLVHIDREGVVKGIEKLTWKVSDPAPDWGYNPPSEEALETLYDSIVGKDSETMEEVDLTTGATNSTTSLVNSVLDAINAVKELSANS